jgi:hypothetical protein
VLVDAGERLVLGEPADVDAADGDALRDLVRLLVVG